MVHTHYSFSTGRHVHLHEDPCLEHQTLLQFPSPSWITSLPDFPSASIIPLAFKWLITLHLLNFTLKKKKKRKVNCLDSMNMFSSHILLVSFSKQDKDKASINRHVFYHIFRECFRLTDNRVLTGWHSDLLRFLITVFLYVVSANKQADQHIFYFCNFITNHVIKY